MSDEVTTRRRLLRAGVLVGVLGLSGCLRLTERSQGRQATSTQTRGTTAGATQTATDTLTRTATDRQTETATNTPAQTATQEPTQAETDTPTETETDTPTETATEEPTETQSLDDETPPAAVSVSGKVVTAAGKPAADVSIEANTNSYPSDITDAQGRFSLEVPSNTPFYLGMYEEEGAASLSERDGVPYIYDFGEYSGSDSDIDLGTLELPEAYVVTLRVLDAEGNPVASAEPDIAAQSDGHWFGVGPSSQYLTEEGYLKIDGAEQMGVELGGQVLLSAEFRDTGAKYEKSFDIDEPTDLIVQAGKGFREASSTEN